MDSHKGGRQFLLGIALSLFGFPVAWLAAAEPSVGEASQGWSPGADIEGATTDLRGLPTGKLTDSDPTVQIRLEVRGPDAQPAPPSAPRGAGGPIRFFADGDRGSMEIFNDSPFPVCCEVLGLDALGVGTLLSLAPDSPLCVIPKRDSARWPFKADGLDGYLLVFAWRKRGLPEEVGLNSEALRRLLLLAAKDEMAARTAFLPGTSNWLNRSPSAERPIETEVALENLRLEAEVRATCYALSGRLSAATGVLQQAIEDCVAKAGKDVWQTATLREFLRDIEQRRRLTGEQRARRIWAEVAMAKLDAERDYCPLAPRRFFPLSYVAGMQTGDAPQERPRRAEVLVPRDVEVTRGAESPALDTADPDDILAALRETALPDSLPLARLRNNLGVLAFASADYERAAEHLRAATHACELRLGPQHPDYATCLGNLGRVCLSCARYPEAERHLRRALEIRRLALGEQHLDFARGLDQLAGCLLVTGDLASAEPLQRRAAEIAGRALGRRHTFYACVQSNLATTAYVRGRIREAAEIWRQGMTSLGETRADNVLLSLLLNNLGTVHRQQEELDQAEQCFRESLRRIARLYGEDHPYVALRWQNLGAVAQDRGEFDQAEQCHLRALKIREAAFGDNHPDVAAALSGLAANARRKGDLAAALAYQRRCLAISQLTVERSLAGESLRKQLLMTQAYRHHLDSYLALVLAAKAEPREAYEHVLRFKGRIWKCQRAARVAEDDPELRPVFRELQAIAARLARLAVSSPSAEDPGNWRRQLDQLAERKEQSERELSARSPAYRAARQDIAVETVLAAVPPDAALVDFLEFGRLLPQSAEQGRGATWQQHLLAFVFAAERPLELVELGPSQPIGAAVDVWRRTFGRGKQGAEAARFLQEHLWAPLEPKLAAANLVLVSPDGVVGRLPLAALPGKRPGEYLLEERAVVTVPVPQVLPLLLQERPEPIQLGLKNVLLVGGVEYDASPDAIAKESQPKKTFGRRVLRGSEWRAFTPLPGTRGELAAIEKMYRDIFGQEGLSTLEKARAGKSSFLAEAPRHRYLHVATHGFFAPPSLRSAFTARADQSPLLGSPGFDDESPQPLGYYPGLLSGLAFAGANREPEENEDDGILTAEEVQTLDLRNVELATLSACETGLGEVAGGEGLLGLERAFQVAGAATVIASLWKVDDAATRDLMERFYDSLWNKDMGKLAALREAQLWMLRERGLRGLRPLDGEEDPSRDNRLPPYAWAAFVLSGDWR